MDNLIRIAQLNFSTYATEIKEYQLNVPSGYILSGCVVTARVLTDNIANVDYKDINTPISYSWTTKGLVKVNLIGGEKLGRGRTIDILAILKKLG